MQTTSAMYRSGVHCFVWTASSGDDVESERAIKLVYLSENSGTCLTYPHAPKFPGHCIHRHSNEKSREKK